MQFYFFWHYDEIKIYRIYCLGIKIDIKGKKVKIIRHRNFAHDIQILTKVESNIDYIIDGIMPDARREEQYIRPKGASIIKTQPISVLLYMYVEFTSAILRQSTS